MAFWIGVQVSSRCVHDCAVGTVTLEALAGSPVWLLGLGVCVVGLAIALAAFLLSHLVLKAAELKSENDLTI